MRRIFFSFLFYFVSLGFLAQPALAAEKINLFKSEIDVWEDATVKVVETIVYDFDEERKHGILREIPIIYKNEKGKKFKIDFQVLSIEDERGILYQYTKTRVGENVKLKIGNPDETITGENTYIITYQVRGVTTYFSDHDELYWNVTGNNWPVSILSASASVNLPQEILSGTKAVCHTGAFGAREKNCQFNFKTSYRAVFLTTKPLSSYEGLTIAVSFPKNIIAYIEPKEAGLPTSFIIPLIVFATAYYLIAPVLILSLWLKYGRDPKVSGPVKAWYDPPKDAQGQQLSPAEVGTLVDEYANERDLSATIVDLAIRGYLKIKEEGQDYLLIKKKEFAQNQELRSYEKMILETFFKERAQVSTKSLRQNFSKTSQKIMTDLYGTLVKKGFFPESPEKVRNKFYLLGILGFITLNFPLGVLSFLFGRIMPRKTLFGAQAKVTALGLKNFLVSQERQLAFQEKNWYLFEKLLPYAIVFGVAHLWAERFKGISAEPPDWYEGEYKGEFSPTVFTSSLLGSTSTFESTVAAPSSSRSTSGFSSGFSGGSSGGGFGGGGGGSW